MEKRVKISFELTLIPKAIKQTTEFMSAKFQKFHPSCIRGGQVVRWCWVNFQYQGIL